MKRTILHLLLSVFCAGFLQAQLLIPVTTGDIVSTPSDSRSCNFVDVNGDGWDDIFISNGPSGGQNNMLYLNNGDGTFTAVTNDPIVQDNSPSDGATFADVDNDGDLDAFVVTWYGVKNFFYRNKGDGTFDYEETTANDGGTYSETANWGDYDNDGWLDLYITNSTDFATNAPAIKRNLLYHNTGDGNFERITTGSPVTDAQISRSVQWTDYDNDGDVDLFISNEENQRNNLYRNDGEGVFTKITDLAFLLDAKSSTGSSWADVDNDGDLDLFIANFPNQNNQLFINEGNGTFREVTEGDLVSDGGCSFGSAFADFDNDGDLDLFVANAFCTGTLQNFLYQNDGNGNFTRDETSISNLVTPSSYGCAWGDFNNDGFLDLVIANCKKTSSSAQPPNSLYQNVGNTNHWLKIQLEGTVSNRSGIGAKVRTKATIAGKTVWQLREVSAQDGYNCQNSLTVHFGLGDATTVDSLLIEWPSGLRTVVENVTPDSTYQIREDQGTFIAPTPQLLPIRLSVSPNPAQTEALVQLSYDQPIVDSVELQLLNLEGKTLWKQSLPLASIAPTQATVQLSTLPAGLYLLTAIANTQSSRPILLQKVK